MHLSRVADGVALMSTSRLMRSLRRCAVTVAALAVVHSASAIELALPNRTGSVKFAVLGDFGTGHEAEYQVASQMAAFRARFPFEFVITTGDNMVGDQDDPADVTEKFERPFETLLDARVRFYASLGNHDKPANRSYALWNMNGRRYYTFTVKRTSGSSRWIRTGPIERSSRGWTRP